ncbi:kunitz-type serine protease inhibitor homolog beta-bungarotoxin B6 chain-like [Centruroides sculpturatus]|uniref:kunitz-type serine protease inhibitor homolog beta-bungarotoxin B6 chain-like n=1 Tax=Centruroides sculpturatus TaxID=218467 RepID=UPI000C6E3AEC|nr:kunitz-type serine protease inhibitor homolog beta-bungarotoxin B6 chain-like [Centruroides sculpturatus]XP_023217491.1 kunitz-type serine protease inhibitor homolog beta-bungarotoxin B6 chain-like [Centruroides sculpturatus]
MTKAMNTEVICVVILVLCVNIDAFGNKVPINCHLQPDERPCSHIRFSYYHNISTRKCELFRYGGCLGNGNHFESLQECCDRCSATNLECKQIQKDIQELIDSPPRPSGKSTERW